MTHTKLTCDEAQRSRHGTIPCSGILGVLSGQWRKVRAIERGEKVGEGRSRIDCRKCGQAWEVEQVREEAA